MIDARSELPTLQTLGLDLLRVSPLRTGLELFAPFLLFCAGSFAAWHWTHLPALYAGLMIAGSWVYPVATAYIVHLPEGMDDLHQTRLFRGKVVRVLALEHLYHLEHHLYPQVPHQNWPKLAARLDPYFERAGLRPVKLLF